MHLLFSVQLLIRSFPGNMNFISLWALLLAHKVPRRSGVAVAICCFKHSWSLQKKPMRWLWTWKHLFDHDSAALSSSFPPNVNVWVIWNHLEPVGQLQLESGFWSPGYALSHILQCEVTCNENILVSDAPEKNNFKKLPVPILMELDTTWYNCLQIASKDMLLFLDSWSGLWIYPVCRTWGLDLWRYATSHWARLDAELRLKCCQRCPQTSKSGFQRTT